MHFATFIVYGSVFLETRSNNLIVNGYNRTVTEGSYHNFEDIQEFSGISGSITEESIGLLDCNASMLEDLVILESTVKKHLKVILAKGLQDKDLAT